MEELKNYENAMDNAMDMVSAEALERTGMNPVVAFVAGTLITVAAVVGGVVLYGKHKEKTAFKPAEDLKIVADEDDFEPEE